MELGAGCPQPDSYLPSHCEYTVCLLFTDWKFISSTVSVVLDGTSTKELSFEKTP